MNLCERVQYLRKEQLNLTQEEFALKIKISRANLGSIEVGRVNVTDRVIGDICSEFNVNEEWLRTGKGEMFFITQKTILEQIIKAYPSLDEVDTQILSTYVSMPLEYRKIFRVYLKSLIDTAYDEYEKEENKKNKLNVYRAAKSINNAEPEILKESKIKIESFKNAPKVTNDDDL